MRTCWPAAAPMPGCGGASPAVFSERAARVDRFSPVRKHGAAPAVDPPMTELWRLSATDLAQRIRTRQVSATEAARDALARLDAVNPRINAVVDHRPEETL